jgi:hypothetical protein
MSRVNRTPPGPDGVAGIEHGDRQAGARHSGGRPARGS